ncbi:MAG: urea amidolyase family protein [Dermatophilaceae bacterium]
MGAGSTFRLLPMGESALLIELAGIAEVLALEAALRARVASPLTRASGSSQVGWAGITDIVPAARTLLLITEPGVDLDALRRAVSALAAQLAAQPVGVDPSRRCDSEVEIPVVYDGPDLDVVARATGLSTQQVIAAHTESLWRVGFGGFAPGFAYLVGGDPRLVVARQATPRTRVPSGSVGLAGEFSGIYPRESPGGWQLIGVTDAALWDADRDPPALLSPGTAVRFVATSPRRATVHHARPVERATPVGRGLEVIATGPLTLVEDLGRVGFAAVGVGRAGAADRSAHRLGARLVGNDPGSAALEVTLGGLQVRSLGSLWVVLTGAAAPATVDRRPVPHAAPFALRPGQVLALGMPLSGLRTYVTVRGGVDLPRTLASESTDTMAGLGPAPLAPGDFVPVGRPDGEFPSVDLAPVPEPVAGLMTLGIAPGPRHDWFARPQDLAETAWVVAARSDRVGVRLEGTGLARHPAELNAELASEGMVRGAVQVPPNGQPVILLSDHPVTGGYPVIGVVPEADVDRAAQVRPGQPVRFRWV